jgi:hypothetical protein
MKQLEKILIGIAAFLIQGWVVKLLWNGVGSAQGLAPITWLEALGWMMLARTLFGTGDIASTLKKSANR